MLRSSVCFKAGVGWLAGATLLVLGPVTGSAGPFPDVSQLSSHRDLPDPLVMFDGTRVTTRAQWFHKRRPELKALFQHYMYGYLPPAPETIQATVEREDRKFFGGKATKKEVTIRFGPAAAPKIHLLLVIPNERRGPAPVFLGLNFCGNHALVRDTSVPIPKGWMYRFCPGCQDNRATAAGRGSRVDTWAIEQSIDRGYAVATFYNGDIDPDRPGFTDGIHPHYFKPGQTKPGPHDWGTIAAWAWGLHRAVDYLQTDKAIDHDRIAVVGHSRNGKTALLAAALDERIGLVIPVQAGCGGTSPSRSKVGESVTQINDRFPHWFNDTFPKFNGKEDLLPFDQHSLISLVAPRPVLLSNAVEDTWADPEGQFKALQAAEGVYRFLDAGGLEASHMPKPGQLIASKLGYYIRPGKHSMTKDDWKVFLDFADRHFGVTKTLRLPPGPANPRNSEGDFIGLRDGRILFVYTHFTGGGSDHSAAHLAGRFSSDGGKTWTTDDVVIVPNEGTWNVMSVSLLRLAGGEIALFYARKNSLTDCRPMMRISKDEAKTWSEPVLCINDEIGYYVLNNDRAVQLKNGRLILPVALHNRPDYKKPDWAGRIMCYLSDDQGRSWRRSNTQLVGTKPDGCRVTVQEPGVVELKDGRLMMFCRSNAGSQYVSHSKDGGDTWLPLHPSNIISPLSPASIERIPKTGDLLLIWNNHDDVAARYRGKRTPFNAAVSRDEGKTWQNVKTLEDDSEGWYCYTAIHFVGDYVLLGHCAGNRKRTGGLAVTQISRFTLDWLYK